MKKRMVLLFLLLAVSAYAQANIESDYNVRAIPEYHDFPLDNIHILRLQEAASSLGGNVTEMKETIMEFEGRRSGEISGLQGRLDSFERSVLTQISSMQAAIDGIDKKVEGAQRPQFDVPASISFPPYIVVLLGINVLLLIIVIILIFWLREQYYVHRETHKEEHIHPAPAELIAYVSHQFEHNRKLNDIRMELASKGWTPSIIEHAIHAAKEK